MTLNPQIMFWLSEKQKCVHLIQVNFKLNFHSWETKCLTVLDLVSYVYIYIFFFNGVLRFLKENAPFRSGILPSFLLGSDPWDIGDIMSTPKKNAAVFFRNLAKFMWKKQRTQPGTATNQPVAKHPARLASFRGAVGDKLSLKRSNLWLLGSSNPKKSCKIKMGNSAKGLLLVWGPVVWDSRGSPK